MSLTPKQQRFVDEYLIDLNATAAYQRAGYVAKGNAAEVNASRLLRNAKVQAAIQAGQEKRAEKSGVKAEQVLAELALIAFSDVGQVLDFSRNEPRLRPASEISEAARRSISSVKVKRYTEGHGDEAREVEVTEFKLWSKDGALQQLGRHLGLFVERHEHTGRNGGPIEHRVMDDAERCQRLTALFDRVRARRMGGVDGGPGDTHLDP
jgi:phage terminase small subunit